MAPTISGNTVMTAAPPPTSAMVDAAKITVAFADSPKTPIAPAAAAADVGSAAIGAPRTKRAFSPRFITQTARPGLDLPIP